ncbi:MULTISPECIES: Glu/Leu/Phe/Val dehydrogenase dimerization domain-containing protein [Prauserella salsuginis group]|uniref:Glu/Leu/Phe/Val dehydrogenase dimerization domain-containing protein n=1 Tax=Prauserella salsuginis TaxID=387889 RepID=A0ABW6G0Y7_9PSEU|nr:MULTISPECIES: Glu/Leu/Phe/Val dehydrogenase dimerization domain-containing protein [Prauserella salsuginis group]MCR3722025.1 leucine dehydrogenase [Prauserella flava]MCR3736031.1 leucine dehydrogenase [Prauserella salsuginis]
MTGTLPWDGEMTCVRHDERTGASFVIALHSTTLGPAAGGTRAMAYPSLDEAVTDARRLARAMSLKMAAADLPIGGGKSVIMLPTPRAQLDDRRWREILSVHAHNLELLNGSYWTGPDVGTGSEDMDVLARTTRFAFGRSVAAGGPGSSAEATAQGVFSAIRASVREVGEPGLDGLRILVQGLGAVGSRVATLVAEAGARLLVTDVDEARCGPHVAAGARIVPAEEVTRTECDVFAPCATGGVIDTDIATMLPARVVAGAANNILATDGAERVLHDRGIIVAPDFVANGGGALHLIGREVLGWSESDVLARTVLIEKALDEVFTSARKQRITPLQAATAGAVERIQA